MPSSAVTSPAGAATGTISPANRPSSLARAARWWLRSANSSWRSRSTW